jgi:hypothetical protein
MARDRGAQNGMSIATALNTASAKPAGKRPYFMTPEVERVMAIAMAIAQELAVARARIDTLERILERKGIMTRAEIETFEPSPAEAAERGLWTQEYIARVLRIVQQEAEQMAAAPNADLASEEVAAEVAKDGPEVPR